MADLSPNSTIDGSLIWTEAVNNLHQIKTVNVVGTKSVQLNELDGKMQQINPVSENVVIELPTGPEEGEVFRVKNVGMFNLLISGWSNYWPLKPGKSARLFYVNDRWYIAYDKTRLENLYPVTLNNPHDVVDSEIENDYFGYSVAVSDKYTAVGAIGYNFNGDNSGRVFVFENETNTLLYELENPSVEGTEQGDAFGSPISISDKYIAVTAINEDYLGSNTGAVYIFEISDGGLYAILDNQNISGGHDNEMFGFSTSIQNHVILVGVPGEDTDTEQNVGVAYLYDLEAKAFIKTIIPPTIDGKTVSGFGTNVCSYGGKLYITAPSSNLNSGYLFIYDEKGETLLTTIENPDFNEDGGAGDNFGAQVVTNGDVFVVSAPGVSKGVDSSSGVVFVFNCNTNEVIKVIENPNASELASNDQFGFSLSISDEYLAVGSPFEHTENEALNNSGVVYVFETGGFNLLTTLFNENSYGTSLNDYYGSAVAICDTALVVGAYREDSDDGLNNGSVYQYALNGKNNITAGYLDETVKTTIFNEEIQAGDGSVLSFDMNDEYLAVGSYKDDTTGVTSGIVHIYNPNTGALLKTINNPNNYDTTEGDGFGSKVLLNGSTLIVSAPFEDKVNFSSAGVVYVFDLLTDTLITTIENPDETLVSENLWGRSIAVKNNLLALVGQFSRKIYLYNLVTGQLIREIGDGSAVNVIGTEMVFTDRYLVASGLSHDGYSGRVYVFDYTTGDLVYTIDNPNTYGGTGSDYFSKAIAANNKLLAVSASREDSAEKNNIGLVYIFNIDDGSFITTLTNPASDDIKDDEFGEYLDMNETHLYVGTRLSDTSWISDGRVDGYQLSNFILVSSIINPNVSGATHGDLFGKLVLTEDKLAVLASGKNSTTNNDTGRFYIY